MLIRWSYVLWKILFDAFKVLNDMIRVWHIACVRNIIMADDGKLRVYYMFEYS